MSIYFVAQKLIYGLLFLTPFLFSSAFNEAFEFPKMHFVYFAGSLLILLAVLKRLWGSGDGINNCQLTQAVCCNSLHRKPSLCSGRLHPPPNGGSFTQGIIKTDELDQSPTFPNDRQHDGFAYLHHGFVRLHGDYTLLAGLFVFSFILSTIFSSHLHTSTWGYFSRFNGGLVSVLIFFGLYWAILQIKPKAQDMLRMIALTILPISLYSIMQHFGLGETWTTDTTTRAFSTFGQPNWYATYCAMVLPIVLYFALNHKNLKQSSSASHKFSLLDYGWYVLYALGFTGFWFAYSISGIIGLITSSVLVLILNKGATLKNWRRLTILLAVCCAIALINLGIFKQRINDVLKDILTNHNQSIIQSSTGTDMLNGPTGNPPENIPSANQTDPSQQTKLAQYNLSDSGFIRKGIWKGTIKLWTASPKNLLIGTGPETFPYEFQFFRPASLNYSSEWNFILNKPHNYYLELLAQNGLLGLLIYLAIVAKVLLAKHPTLTPGLAGLFVINIFGWPTVYATLLFWTFLALLALKTNPPDPTTGQLSVPLRTALTLLIVSLYLYANILFGRQILADMFSKASDNYFGMGESQNALAYSNKSVELNRNEPYYYRQRAKTYILTLVGQPKEQTEHIKALAYNDILTATNLNPKNLATLRGNISLHYFLALEDLVNTANNFGRADSDTPATISTDPRYLSLASDYYTILSRNYPNDVGVQTQVAKYQKLLGLKSEYEETLQKVEGLRPDLLVWYLR